MVVDEDICKTIALEDEERYGLVSFGGWTGVASSAYAQCWWYEREGKYWFQQVNLALVLFLFYDVPMVDRLHYQRVRIPAGLKPNMQFTELNWPDRKSVV